MTPQTPSYPTNIRLNEQDKEALDFLRTKGRTIIGVLRTGIKAEIKKERAKK